MATHFEPAAPVAHSDEAMLRALLPRVSRTFALGIRLLPPALSRSVTIAYLICRVADTIEDDATLPATVRAELLALFAGWLARPPKDSSPLTGHFAPPSNNDEVLVSLVDRVLAEYRRLSPEEQAAIRGPVEEMCGGMARYVARTGPGPHAQQPRDMADLEAYCWYVAGTVGWLLTDLFRLADRTWSTDQYARLRELSRGFGLGLQLTNVIRDIGEDHARGVTFVPADLCAEVGADPLQLFSPGRARETSQVIEALTARAAIHLDRGLEYCLTLPRRSYRVRLFCLVPLLLATRTLGMVRAERRFADRWVRVKLTRAAVRAVLVLSVLIAPSNLLIRRAFRWLSAVPHPAAP